MKKIFLFLSVLFFLVDLSPVSAQPEAGNGCKVGIKRYQQPYSGETQYNNFPLYSGIGGVKYSDWEGIDNMDPQYSCYRWISGAANSCYIKNSNCTNPSCYTIGDAGYFTGPSVNCPIDNYTWFLIIILGGLGSSLISPTMLFRSQDKYSPAKASTKQKVTVFL